jgi:methionine-gamma-lyase
MSNPSEVEGAMTAETRVVYFESPANPNMRMVDISAVAEIAYRHGAKVVVDNTYCSSDRWS